MVVQGASGVAKDLAKMSSKSAVKLLAPEAEGGLFRWVAALTGSKNAVKGVGFLLGAALLATLGFAGSVWAMAGVLAVILAPSHGRCRRGCLRDARVRNSRKCSRNRPM